MDNLWSLLQRNNYDLRKYWLYWVHKFSSRKNLELRWFAAFVSESSWIKALTPTFIGNSLYFTVFARTPSTNRQYITYYESIQSGNFLQYHLVLLSYFLIDLIWSSMSKELEYRDWWKFSLQMPFLRSHLVFHDSMNFIKLWWVF